MTARPEAASPVIAPRTMTLTGVFSGVHLAARNRLDHTIPNLADHSQLPNTIAQGPATVPRAQVPNPLVAEVRSFEPGPGIQMARRNVLNVQNDPGHQDDGVIDALQRYFNVRPRREPSADPRDEASVVRHPQELVQSSARWTQDMFYQFTDNGAANYQVRPDYRAWGGRLDLELTGAGQTSVSAPATRAPRPGAAAIGGPGYYDPANAAQEAQAKTTELLSRPAGSSAIRVGPPGLLDNPYFDPPFTARNVVSQIRADLTPNQSSMIRVGAPAMVDNPYFDPPFTARNVVSRIQADLAPNQSSMIRVGPPTMVDNPYFDPTFTARNVASQIQADLTRAQQIRDAFFMPGPALSNRS